MAHPDPAKPPGIASRFADDSPPAPFHNKGRRQMPRAAAAHYQVEVCIRGINTHCSHSSGSMVSIKMVGCFEQVRLRLSCRQWRCSRNSAFQAYVTADAHGRPGRHVKTSMMKIWRERALYKRCSQFIRSIQLLFVLLLIRRQQLFL